MRNILFICVFSLFSTSAVADVSKDKIAIELGGWFTDFTLVEVIDTKTSENGESVIAYLGVVNKSGKYVTGSATFSKLDSGTWYLMHFSAGTGISAGHARNILRPVQIE